jgi:REP element-mobilizing transposase RayT
MTTKDPKPHGFHPIDLWKSDLLSYRRRNLPHFEVSDATYFVTFHIRPGLLLPDAARDQVMRVIEGCDKDCLELQAAVVMPDHVHLIFRIIERSLANVLQKIKGSSARQVNFVLKRTGSLWMEESFDHVIRHEAELQEKIEYVRNNPVKKGLVDDPQQYRWLYVKKITEADGHLRFRKL